MSEIPTLFDRFGGVRKMAETLGEPPSTVQSWKTAGRIPAGKQPDVLARAKELQLDIDAEDLIFPLGRDVHTEMTAASAANGTDNFGGDIALPQSTDKSPENIGAGDRTAQLTEGAPPPFGQAPEDQRSSGASRPTSSPTSARSNSSPDNPTCSDGDSEAAAA